MTTQHTPGPWKVSQSASLSAGRPVKTRDGQAVALCPAAGLGLPFDQACDQADANARLIAAAPDLLEACKRALDIINKETCGFYGDDRKIIESAIAKATGEDQS